MKIRIMVLLVAAGCVCLAQKPFQAQGTSSINLSGKPDELTLEISNIAYEVTSAIIPGLPKDQRLVLRKTARSKRILDEVGTEASITLEAWPLGKDLKQKPLYSLFVSGTDGHTHDGTLFVASRGTEEVDWWSVYQLGTARHLFDTYVPVVSFSISRETLTQRYAGFEVPPDDIQDARLKEPHVVGVVSYASAERVIREALLTCDDPKQAQLLRSLADATRTLALVEGPLSAKGEPSRTLRLITKQEYPSPPAPVTVQIPIAGDDLDLAHTQLPPKMHLAAWKR